MKNVDEQIAYRRLADLYARAMDSTLPEILKEVMDEKAVISNTATKFRAEGMTEILVVPAMLAKRFRSTQHLVHNQTIAGIEDDQAEGETYCTAYHIYDGENGVAKLIVWHLRYVDRLVRRDGNWRFLSRRLNVDWTETRRINPAHASTSWDEMIRL